MCLASLLRVRSALRSFATDEENLPEDLQPLTEMHFWKGVVMAERIMRPVAAMSFVLEKSNTTLAHVIHAIGTLYQNLMVIKHEEGISTLVDDLCKRWKVQEQPLFLLAYVLHPHFTNTALNVLTRMSDSGPYARYFNKQTLARVADAYFKKWFEDYVPSENEDSLQYLMFRFLTEESFRTRLFPSGCFLFNSSWTCHSAWEWVLESPTDCQLAKFALKLLGAQPQSADQERVFKEFARHHTSVRNHMSTSTMTKLSMVKAHYIDKQRAARGKQQSKNRILMPDERPRVPQREQQMPENDARRDNGESEDADEDEKNADENVVEFWNDALQTVESDDDCDEWIEDVIDCGQIVHLDPSVYGNYNDFRPLHSERIASIISSPLPHLSDCNYPQENLSSLKNFRAAKFPLLHLFGYPGAGNQESIHPGHVELFPLV